MKIVVASDGRALYFSRASIPVYRDNPEYTFIKHIGIYGYKRDAITTLCQLQPSFLEKAERLEQLRALENNIPIHVVMTETDTHAVDVLEDIAIVEDKLRK